MGTMHPSLSEMDIYMTPRQLFEHTTTYFHFGDMNGHETENQNDKEQQNGDKKVNEIVHNIPPPNALFNGNGNGSQIYNYIKSKDLSTSPLKNNRDDVHCKDDSKK